MEVEDFVWDRQADEINDVSSFSVLDATGAVVATSFELDPIVLTVPAAGAAYYLRINGTFSLASQYEASYTRLGSVTIRRTSPAGRRILSAQTS